MVSPGSIYCVKGIVNCILLGWTSSGSPMVLFLTTRFDMSLHMLHTAIEVRSGKVQLPVLQVNDGIDFIAVEGLSKPLNTAAAMPRSG